MSRFRPPPITFTVPALVAGLMIVVSVLVSERVLSRLIDTQERQLQDLSDAYLDGMSSSLVPHVLREDVWEVFDALARSEGLYGALRPTETVVVGSDGTVIAASDPARVPSLEPLPRRFTQRLHTTTFAIDEQDGRVYLRRALDYRGTPIGAIYAIADIRHLLRERSEVMWTLVVTNTVLTLLLAGAGYLVVRRMVRPVRVLADHLSSAASDRPQPIGDDLMPASGTEARRLFDAYNALVEAEREREGLSFKLAEEERLASVGRLAAGMAHEINNPLGGLFNALDTLKRHGETAAVRETAVSLLERGLNGIRDVVAAALHTYRPERDPHPLGPRDFEDLRLLVRPEVRRRSLELDWSNALEDTVDIPNAPVRQAVLNVLLNACAATPEGGEVSFAARVDGGELVIEIEDAGDGLPQEAVEILADPQRPAPIAGDGLGLWMVQRSITQVGGTVEVASSRHGGTRVRIGIPASVARTVSNEREATHGAA